MAAFRVVAGSGLVRNKDDWYCKSCADYWGGHYVNRGHRVECYKCKLAKGQVFFGKPSTADCPSKRVAPRATPDTDVKKENAKLRAELARLKQAPGRSGTVELETNDELDKLVADAKSVRALAKSVPCLGDALAGMDARIAELRADRLKVKPGSERLRQLEGETKRKQSELASIQSKRVAANERIAKEQAAIEKLDADGVFLAAAIAKLQESVARLAEEIQVNSSSDPFRGSAAADATGNTEAKEKEEMEVDPEVAQAVATNLGVEGGAKRVLEIFAAAAAAAVVKRTKMGP